MLSRGPFHLPDRRGQELVRIAPEEVHCRSMRHLHLGEVLVEDMANGLYLEEVHHNRDPRNIGHLEDIARHIEEDSPVGRVGRMEPEAGRNPVVAAIDSQRIVRHPAVL